jgi:hypothetical protein
MSPGTVGRPPLEDEDRRSAVLKIRLNEEELDALEAAAVKREQPVSTWARDVLLRAAKR